LQQNIPLNHVHRSSLICAVISRNCRWWRWWIGHNERAEQRLRLPAPRYLAGGANSVSGATEAAELIAAARPQRQPPELVPRVFPKAASRSPPKLRGGAPRLRASASAVCAVGAACSFLFASEESSCISRNRIYRYVLLVLALFLYARPAFAQTLTINFDQYGNGTVQPSVDQPRLWCRWETSPIRSIL